MYEEVCLLCGRPVLADGRPYCSDECESLDVTSPSISTTSSPQPSPLLHSTANASGVPSEVPALLPSALGHSLREARRSHRIRHSESSSSNSSVSWSALEDDYDDDAANPALYSAGTDDEFAIYPDYASAEPGSSKPSSYSLYRNPRSSLAYVRRPSSTNNRSLIPMLHHRGSSVSTPSSNGMSRSVPQCCSTEDDSSDVPSACASSVSGRSRRRSGRKSTDSVPHVTDDSEREKDDTVTGKNRRNRASLPAYFSLLASTSPASARSQKSLSSLQTLSMVSRSLQSSSSPPTPRLAKPVVDMTTAFATAQQSRVSKSYVVTADVAPRGRSRQRDPDGRSSSSRRSSSRSPGARAQPHRSAHVRARLDSMEKVADWVAQSPVVAASVRIARQQVQQHPHQRRNSSPPPLPKFEKLHLRDAGIDIDASHSNSAVEEFEEDDEFGGSAMSGSRRGRRRPDELDTAPPGVDRNAPGFGNGRSGLLARERTRGRTAILKR
ncbi:hypothetical protein BV20DRAFT_941277 [Pilatotrama ljubarskyi]|nr:hypothetical protein BV20DRAFT_941277 [Pilatotrama ljubarskyi]